MMNDVSNFYETLNLCYNEIAIAMDDIDRIDPGVIRFIIPVLTPNMSTNSIYEDKIRLNSSNLNNRDTQLEIDDLNVTNYVKIIVPKELCAFVGGVFEVEEYEPLFVYPRESVLHFRDGKVYIDDANQVGSGSVVEGGSINVNGHVNGVIKVKDSIPSGFLNLMPVDRYIYAPSKWIITFIGGDATKPRILARYPEDAEEK